MSSSITTDRRITQNPSLPTAARRLFQDDVTSERDNDINYVNELMQRSNEDAKRKWNFDFENEIPLEGDWIWEKIDNNHNDTNTIKTAAAVITKK